MLKYLDILGEEYAFNFGMGFVRTMNKKFLYQDPSTPGLKTEMGLTLAISKLLDADLDALEDILLTANSGQTPRLKRETLDTFIEDDNTDIDSLFNEVMDFLRTANATKKIMQKAEEAAAEAKKNA